MQNLFSNLIITFYKNIYYKFSENVELLSAYKSLIRFVVKIDHLFSWFQVYGYKKSFVFFSADILAKHYMQLEIHFAQYIFLLPHMTVKGFRVLACIVFKNNLYSILYTIKNYACRKTLDLGFPPFVNLVKHPLICIVNLKKSFLIISVVFHFHSIIYHDFLFIH